MSKAVEIIRARDKDIMWLERELAILRKEEQQTAGSNHTLKAQVEENGMALDALGRQVASLQEEISLLAAELVQREEMVADLAATLAEKDQAVQYRAAQVEERERIIQARDEAIKWLQDELQLTAKEPSPETPVP